MPFCDSDSSSSSGDEVEDKDADRLSYVGDAAYEELRKHHNHYWHEAWNVTSGLVIGEVHQTPGNLRSDAYGSESIVGTWGDQGDPPDGHSDWFPRKMGEIMRKTRIWLDAASLGPPDGLFMEEMKNAITFINQKALERGGAASGEDNVKIRMLFGNIIGMPVDCTAVINELTSDIDLDQCKIQLWVGAWRQGVTWNHAKIIAVDGKYLHTGGHNLWDPHYLKNNPVHDLSMQAQGRCAHDGHLFLNKQWEFIQKMQSGFVGWLVNKLPDRMPTVLQTRVTVSEFPEDGDTPTFPDMYEKQLIPFDNEGRQGHVPMITMGRYGSLLLKHRPSDDAFIAMVGASKEIIRMALQDIGPCCFPGAKIALPGCTWPKPYLKALGRAILRGVDVEIALSNPGSIPGGLSPTEALYGNGWGCADVASEIIKTIKDQVDESDSDDSDEEAGLRSIITENLRICYIRQSSTNEWGDEKTMGMHAKHFIIDDMAYYIGSQNWYVCDLAEWGILVDDANQTRKVLQEYWFPMWHNSFQPGQDVDVDEVLNGLDIDRDGDSMVFKSYNERQALIREAAGNYGATRQVQASSG